MGSKLRHLRQLEGEIQLSEIMAQVEGARSQKSDPEEPVRYVRFYVRSSKPGGLWEVLLSVMNEEGVEHWHCSAMLYPRGRGSAIEDWNMLGRTIAVVSTATGFDPERGKPEALTDEELVHPSLPRHFIWHADNSRCPETELIRQVASGVGAKG